MSVDPKSKALEAALQQIEKSLGKGTVMRLGESSHVNVQAIPTGCLALDVALGVGGLPKGRIIELYGPESGGKTSVSLTVAGQVQKSGGTAAIIDVEHAVDPVWAEKLGVDIGNLLIAQPDTAEDALEVADALVRSGSVDLVIIDSVAALVPKAEMEGDMGDSHMGLQARLMSQALRKLGGSVSRSNSCLIFINQIREKIGVMFGNPEVTPGGRALKFWASVRIEVRKGEPIKDGAEVIGNRTKIKIVKNKVAPPFRTCEFDLLFSEGISQEGCVLDLGAQVGIITRSGAFYSYKEWKLGQGRENARQFLKQNPDVCAEIEAELRGKPAKPSEEDE